MRALFLGHLDPQRLHGGAERLVADLGRELSRVHGVAFATRAELPRLDLAGFDVVHVAGNAPDLVARARRAGRPKVVVTFHGSPLGLVALGRRTGRGGVFRLGQALLHARALRRAAATIRAADAVHAGSARTGHDLVRQCPAARDRVVVIEHGIDTERFTPAGARDDGFVLFVGRLERSKGIDRLVRAFERRAERLVVAGTGTLEHELRAIAGPRVAFTGAVEDADLLRLYRSASVCVFPSLYEGFGLVALEALACGTPAVASEAFAIGPPAGDLLARFPVADDRGMMRALDLALGSKTPAWSCAAHATVRRRHDVRREAGELRALYERVARGD